MPDAREFPIVIAETETVSATDLTPLLVQEIAANTKFTRNLGNEVLVVSADKVRLRLRTLLDKRRTRSAWQTPAGILVTLIAALVASDFKNLWFPSETWLAIFWLSAAACSIWLLVSLKGLFVSRNISIDALVESLRTDDRERP